MKSRECYDVTRKGVLDIRGGGRTEATDACHMTFSGTLPIVTDCVWPFLNNLGALHTSGPSITSISQLRCRNLSQPMVPPPTPTLSEMADGLLLAAYSFRWREYDCTLAGCA